NEYLYGIAEEPDSWPPEALKALAVAARTYVMEKKLNPTSRHKVDGFDVCSTSDCQCYVGIRNAPNLKSAVDATTGQILTHPEAPYGAIITAYHSCCGGYTEDNENVWGGNALAFLRGVPCGFCNWSPNFNFSFTFPDYELENKLKSSPLTTPLGNLLGLEILSRGVSGRVTSLRIIGSEGNKVLDLSGVNTFKTLLGLKSTFFNFRPSTRLSGNNRYSTAVAISKEGWTSSTTVILASGENFPDALAGAPLAYKNNCPLLLTKATFLTSETLLEISRLGAAKVIILGGEGAVSKEVEDALKAKGLAIQRIGGKNRYETAAFIAKELGSPGSTAVLVTGENFPDALAISPYAAYNKIPVLLTRKDVLPEETKKVIGELGITNVIVVGGSGVVSSSALLSLPSYVRVGGTDRYDTARLIAERYFRSVYASENVFIATGETVPDALSGAPLAASKGPSPVLLVKKTSVPAPTRDYVMGYSSSIKYAYILGGEGAVSKVVKQAIEGM
ncbi:MAG: cell wall-binding repeat-containing protein, partial [Candidatus Subteraquimicrobiales bacterium]|nr:cell wall-binding repeat-containing protein [Candidatus Subteraquimicrobiales bacterium]